MSKNDTIECSRPYLAYYPHIERVKSHLEISIQTLIVQLQFSIQTLTLCLGDLWVFKRESIGTSTGIAMAFPPCNWIYFSTPVQKLPLTQHKFAHLFLNKTNNKQTNRASNMFYFLSHTKIIPYLFQEQFSFLSNLGSNILSEGKLKVQLNQARHWLV